MNIPPTLTPPPHHFLRQLMCSNDDLKELGIPMGPRKKLSSYISEQAEKQRIAKVQSIAKVQGIAKVQRIAKVQGIAKVQRPRCRG